MKKPLGKFARKALAAGTLARAAADRPAPGKRSADAEEEELPVALQGADLDDDARERLEELGIEADEVDDEEAGGLLDDVGIL